MGCNSHSAFTGPSRRLSEMIFGRPAMIDVLYLTLGLVVFVAFAFGIRAADRL